MSKKEYLGEVDQSIIDDLNKFKNKLLFVKETTEFVIIKDFDYIEKMVTEKKFWSREQIQYKKYYITTAKIIVWSEGRWKVFSDMGIEQFFDPMYYVSPGILRGAYVNRIKTPLEDLGAVFNSNPVNE